MSEECKCPCCTKRANSFKEAQDKLKKKLEDSLLQIKRTQEINERKNKKIYE